MLNGAISPILEAIITSVNILSYPLEKMGLHEKDRAVWHEAFQPPWWKGVDFKEPCFIKKGLLIELWKGAIKRML